MKKFLLLYVLIIFVVLLSSCNNSINAANYTEDYEYDENEDYSKDETYDEDGDYSEDETYDEDEDYSEDETYDEDEDEDYNKDETYDDDEDYNEDETRYEVVTNEDETYIKNILQVRNISEVKKELEQKENLDPWEQMVSNLKEIDYTDGVYGEFQNPYTEDNCFQNSVPDTFNYEVYRIFRTFIARNSFPSILYNEYSDTLEYQLAYNFAQKDIEEEAKSQERLNKQIEYDEKIRQYNDIINNLQKERLLRSIPKYVSD